MTDGETLDAVIAAVQRDGQEATDGETLAAILAIVTKWADGQ